MNSPSPRREGQSAGFMLEDLVGVDVRSSPPSRDKNACQMNVHVYAWKVERKKTTRRMNVLSVYFDAQGSFDENRAEASKWKDAIKLSSYCRLRQVFHNTSDTEGVAARSCGSLRNYFKFVF